MPGHDASTYKMNAAEAAQIKAAGGQVHRVVLDFEFEKAIPGELTKQGDYGKLSYPRWQEKPAKLRELPIDLELATENYRPAHISPKLRSGSRTAVNSTWGGRRAEWEGRELMAQVVALRTSRE